MVDRTMRLHDRWSVIMQIELITHQRTKPRQRRILHQASVMHRMSARMGMHILQRHPTLVSASNQNGAGTAQTFINRYVLT